MTVSDPGEAVVPDAPQNGSDPESLHPVRPIPGAEEKVGVKEMLLMILSAWGIFLPVAIVILLAMVLITRFLFGV